MNDSPGLFDGPDGESLHLPGAEIRLFSCPGIVPSPDVLLDALIAETPWRQERISLFGKSHLQPRLVAWYGDPDASYRYSGLTLEPLPWTVQLQALKSRVESLAGASFNSVLLNYYRDQDDAMGLHADDEPELGPQPVIASLSLGETRTLVFKHRHDRAIKPVKIPLSSGSLLIMQGDTQANWKHGINRQAAPCGPRVNLTFRRILA